MKPTSFASRAEFEAVSPGLDFIKLTAPKYRGLPEGYHTGGPWIAPGGKEVWKLQHGGCWVNSAIELAPTQEAECMAAMAGEPGHLPRGAWSTFQALDGWTWIVKPMMPVLEDGDFLGRSEALTIERGVRAMNELGWVLQDAVRVAFYQGQFPVILDLSTARPWAKPSTWGYYNDQSYVNRLMRHHGQERMADLREAVHSIWNVESIWRRHEWRPFEQWYIYAGDAHASAVRSGDVHVIQAIDAPCANWIISKTPLDNALILAFDLELVAAPLQDRRPQEMRK